MEEEVWGGVGGGKRSKILRSRGPKSHSNTSLTLKKDHLVQFSKIYERPCKTWSLVKWTICLYICILQLHRVHKKTWKFVFNCQIN